MKKSEMMMKKVMTKLETIYGEEDFLTAILGSMKKDIDNIIEGALLEEADETELE